jgi:hypothetical protein
VDFAFAQTGSKGTGALSASGSVYLGPCVLTQLLVQTNGTNNATVTVYDNSTNSGTVVTTWSCPGPGANSATNTCVQEWPYVGREIQNGIYVAISGTGASYIVEYRTR